MCSESTEFITGHVIYYPAYTYKFQLKTTSATGRQLMFFRIKHHGVAFEAAAAAVFGERAFTSEVKSPKPNLPTIDILEQFQSFGLLCHRSPTYVFQN